MGFQLVPKSVT